jgi:hypothetical protein
MYHEKIRGVQDCALNKDLFLQNKQEDKLNSISNRGIKMGRLNACLIPGMLLSCSFEPDLSHTSTSITIVFYNIAIYE